MCAILCNSEGGIQSLVLQSFNIATAWKLVILGQAGHSEKAPQKSLFFRVPHRCGKALWNLSFGSQMSAGGFEILAWPMIHLYQTLAIRSLV
jgi:hypothetical protein